MNELMECQLNAKHYAEHFMSHITLPERHCHHPQLVNKETEA